MARTDLDKRLNAFRPDLADLELQGLVDAKEFRAGRKAKIISRFADVLGEPAQGAALQTQFIFGQTVKVFDQGKEFSWVQNLEDGYVGYVSSKLLGELTEANEGLETHMVRAPRTFLYPGPDLKLPRSGFHSIGARLCVVDRATTRGTNYLILDTGESVIANHLLKVGEWLKDPVAVAETLLHTPYLWGGNTGFGIDCSGLISLSNKLCGTTVLRDSDMQQETIGEEIEADFSKLQRGDLVFWKGHVGMMADEKNLLHANGNTMNVAVEPLQEAIDRIGYLYSKPTSVKRP